MFKFVGTAYNAEGILETVVQDEHNEPFNTYCESIYNINLQGQDYITNSSYTAYPAKYDYIALGW